MCDTILSIESMTGVRGLEIKAGSADSHNVRAGTSFGAADPAKETTHLNFCTAIKTKKHSDLL